jgi:hypothetical protein
MIVYHGTYIAIDKIDFYSTNTYKELISQETYLWTESSSFIADESLRELGLYKKH